jgi:hypothetical protein
MARTELIVNVAAKMYMCRDRARVLLGDDYASVMRDLGGAIRAVAKRDKCDELSAWDALMKSAGLEGIEALFFTSAFVEMIEPSGAGQSEG